MTFSGHVVKTWEYLAQCDKNRVLENMYVCLYIHTQTHKHMHTYIHTYMHTYIHLQQNETDGLEGYLNHVRELGWEKLENLTVAETYEVLFLTLTYVYVCSFSCSCVCMSI
jgi:hypothetical protein